jgi:hypothetical protein
VGRRGELGAPGGSIQRAVGDGLSEVLGFDGFGAV